jgi:hypothetical protein
MDEDDYLGDGIRVQMDEFDFVVIKESTHEIVHREPKSTLVEGREHHNVISVGCGDIFPSGGVPLQHDAIRKEAIHN